ncbi:trichohyalin-like [Selaginella moellendorffii]|uniref:trichohyalin-like n=1 Tax=Selaginella moellendorffii TaxID=88036 RepID=UPI000D1C444B|nr:trichohyalin-like [Selaginella moellendorffii]|eukprot:XP_024541826.1 trichohyalin-like [Selaginella moellendorffii]
MVDAQRYQELKCSIQELKSQVRAKASPRLALPMPAAAPPSASMQLLQLQFDLLEEARQEEFLRLQGRVLERSKHLEVFRAKCEKKIKKGEDNFYLLKENVRRMECQFCERVSAAEQDFLDEQEKLRSRYKDLEVEQLQRERDLIASYDSTISRLERNNDEKSVAKKVIEEQLKRVMDENSQLRERIMLLELESRSAKDEFRRMYREQEKQWNIKIQSVTESHECELESLKSSMEKEGSKIKEEKLQLSSEFQEYKAQKVKEMDLLDQRIRAALEHKDAKILHLNRELQILQQQLNQANNLFEQEIA